MPVKYHLIKVRLFWSIWSIVFFFFSPSFLPAVPLHKIPSFIKQQNKQTNKHQTLDVALAFPAQNKWGPAPFSLCVNFSLGVSFSLSLCFSHSFLSCLFVCLCAHNSVSLPLSVCLCVAFLGLSFPCCQHRETAFLARRIKIRLK